MDFKYQYTFLLYLVSEGYKQGFINDQERIKIKKLIIVQDSTILGLMAQFEKDGKTERLWKGMKACAISKEECKDSDEISTGIEQMSSPVDTALIREKKKTNKRNNEQILKEGVNQFLETTYEVRCKKCAVGSSPPLFKKRYFEGDEQ
jgi:hypothetical protein